MPRVRPFGRPPAEDEPAVPATPATTTSPEEAERRTVTSGLYLDQARWLWDQQAERINRFHARSGQLLAFEGVLLALMLQAVPPIQALPHGGRRDWATGLAITAVASLSLAAVCSVTSMRTIGGKGIDVHEAQASWAHWLSTHSLSPRGASGTFAEALYGEPGDSPLVSIADEADDRARWYTRSTWLVLLGLFAIALLVGILA